MDAPYPLPTLQPADRTWALDEALEIKRYGALTESWTFSAEEIARIKAALAAAALPETVITLAVAGSLGRMEAAREVSDCDLIIVLTERTRADENEAQRIYDYVWGVLKKLGIKTPKAMGVFSKATSIEELCDPKNFGAYREDLPTFAKRLLLLLETQPVFHHEGYQKVIRAVLNRYADPYVAQDPRKEWVLLINDLIRYFRSICVNYQWDFDNEHGKWPIRNVKLRHSRVVMYMGLLMLLGECSHERRNKVDWLEKRLLFTPLERIAAAYCAARDTSFFRIAGAYDIFLGLLSKDEVRKELNNDKLQPGSYEMRYQMRNYAILKANSDGLAGELVRFIMSRRGDWSERFFEYLLF